MINDLNIIVSSIVKEGALFLKNDMNIELIEIKSIQGITLGNHTGVVELTGNQRIMAVVSIDNNLFSVLFNKFFSIALENDEKNEFENELPNEIINTIVGLSIRHFPLNCDNLVLQPPLHIKKEKLNKMIAENKPKEFKISTINGDLDFAVFLE